jgi:hypothetical protein
MKLYPKERTMIRNFVEKLFLCSVMAICLLAVPSARAQSATLSTPASAGPSEASPVYDLTKEINIQGTIQKIETTSGPGILGTHLQLQTAQGIVDAHLGSGTLASTRSLGLATGESVSITGMMTDLGGVPVLLARVLTTSNRIFILRNERGIPARAMVPRSSSSSAEAQKGGD